MSNEQPFDSSPLADEKKSAEEHQTSQAPAPAGGRRAARQAQLRQRLLASARTVFARVGLAEATIAQITTEADVGFGTFYLYFPTKEAVYHAVIRDGFASLNAQLDAILHQGRAHQQPWEHVLDAAVSAYLQFVADNQDLYLVLVAPPAADVPDVVLQAVGRIAALVHYVQRQQAGQPPVRLLDDPAAMQRYPLALVTAMSAAVLNRAALWWLRQERRDDASPHAAGQGDAHAPSLEEASTLIRAFLLGGLARALPPPTLETHEDTP